MRVSIVTLSLNQRAFLERALLSVLEQGYEDVEYIVVDGGSTDGSLELLESYRSRLAALSAGPDGGPADGLNRGFALATGDVLAYVNADDALLPGAVERAVSWFASDPSLDVVYAHGYIVDADGRLVRRFRSTSFDRRRYARGSVVVMQQSTFFRRRALEGVGGFNVANRTCWDAEFLLDAALQGRCVRRVDDYWSLFTIHPGSLTGSQRRAHEYESDSERLFEKAMQRPPRGVDLVARRLARLEKWGRDPRSAFIRLVDAVRPPKVGLPCL